MGDLTSHRSEGQREGLVLVLNNLLGVATTKRRGRTRREYINVGIGDDRLSQLLHPGESLANHQRRVSYRLGATKLERADYLGLSKRTS